MIDDDDDKKELLEKQLREIKNRRFQRKRRVRRNRKILKQTEDRADTHARCLTEELDLKVSNKKR